jgi:signal transduction histidine kinase
MEPTWAQRDAIRVFRIILAVEMGFSVAGLVVQLGQAPSFALWYWTYLAARVSVAALTYLPWAERALGRWLLALVLGLDILLGGVDAAIAPLGLLGFWSGAFDWDGSSLSRLQQVPAQSYLLLIPVTLLAWGYSRRGALYGSALAALLVVLGTGLAVESFVVTPLYLLSVGMLLVMLFVVPLIVSVLAERERLQHAELAAAYGTLQRHAATVEQLAVSRERNRLARELHDTLAHSLSAIAIQLEALRTLQAHNPQAAEQAVLGLGGLARQGLADARHAIQELRSDPVQNMGLQGALREMLSALEARSGLVARMDVSGQESDLTLEEAGALYRIAEEALLNVERHARAEHVALALEQSRVLVRLSVVDDGRGFDPRQVPADRYGLMGMHERAAIIGGTLEVTSAPDQGTTVRCTLSR